MFSPPPNTVPLALKVIISAPVWKLLPLNIDEVANIVAAGEDGELLPPPPHAVSNIAKIIRITLFIDSPKGIFH